MSAFPLYSQDSRDWPRQLVGDLLVLAWIGAWVWAGRWVHDQVAQLAAPGRRLEAAGSTFRANMTEAAGRVDNLPLLDDQVAAPFRTAAATGADLETTGQELAGAAQQLALGLGWSVALVPILTVGSWWLWRRVLFVRRAGAAQRLLAGGTGIELFALRALVHQPMRQLARTHPDPAGAWRDRDPVAIGALAALELRTCGLVPAQPVVATGPRGDRPAVGG